MIGGVSCKILGTPTWMDWWINNGAKNARRNVTEADAQTGCMLHMAKLVCVICFVNFTGLLL